MIGAIIAFFSVIMIIGIALTVSFGLILCVFCFFYGFFSEAHQELSAYLSRTKSTYRFPTKKEILENLSALFTVTILVTTGSLSYFYFEYSLWLSILFAFIATCLFVLMIRFNDVKNEYRKLKHS